MRHAALDRVLRRRQRLTEHLAAEHLRAADVAARATKDIGLDPLEFEQVDEVFKNRVHRGAAPT